MTSGHVRTTGLEGHQPAGTRGFSIAEYLPHPRAEVLDELVDRMTRVHPEKRPSMEQVARDLKAWQELAAQPVLLDISEQQQSLRRKLASQLSRRDVEEERKDNAQKAVRRFQELLEPINRALKVIYSGSQIDLATDGLTEKTVRTDLYGHHTTFRWQRRTLILSVKPFSWL